MGRDEASLLSYQLTKLNSSGDSLWTKYFSPAPVTRDEPAELLKTSSGDFILTGNSISLHPTEGFDDAYLVKVDAEGDTIWTVRVSTEGGERIYSAALVENDGIVLCGEKSTPSQQSMCMLIDSSRELVWQETYNPFDWNVSNNITYTDGGVILTGWTMRDEYPYWAKGFIRKVDLYGETIWYNEYYESMSAAQGEGLVRISDGSICMTGVWGDALGGRLLVLKTEQDLRAIDYQENADEFAVLNNYPNPFNSSTTIKFSIPRTANAELIVYDLLGREVTTLHSGLLSAGEHRCDFSSTGLPSGVYVYHLQGDDFSAARKMLLLK